MQIGTYHRALCKIVKRSDVMAERDLAKFKFEKSFRQNSYTAITSRQR